MFAKWNFAFISCINKNIFFQLDVLNVQKMFWNVFFIYKWMEMLLKYSWNMLNEHAMVATFYYHYYLLLFAVVEME